MSPLLLLYFCRLAIPALAISYAKPATQRRAVLKEIYAMSQTLQEAGALDALPEGL